jgi:trimethylamine corrinoid protein
MTASDLNAALTRAVLDGDKSEAETLARQSLGLGLDPHETIERGAVPGIQKAGSLWEEGDYFLPELISSAEAMKAALAVLRPALDAGRGDDLSLGRIVIGTVEGDIHDIGKNLVAAMLSANGFDVIDLGADVKLETFLRKAEEVKADLVCLSALLTTTMLGQRRFLEALKAQGIRDKFKVLIGGAPASQRWADEIGADGYGENAPAAVRAAKAILGKG